MTRVAMARPGKNDSHQPLEHDALAVGDHGAPTGEGGGQIPSPRKRERRLGEDQIAHLQGRVLGDRRLEVRQVVEGPDPELSGFRRPAPP